MISLPVISYSQITDPPETNDEFGWMRWVIVTLAGALITAFGIIKKIYDDRIKDKDKEITDLKDVIKDLNNDKDQLQKDIMDKVIPAVLSANELIKTFMNNK